METVTLSGEDFKKLHNSLCDLRHLSQRMDKSMIKTDELDRIIKMFEQALKNCYDQDEDAFDRKMDYYRKYQEDCGFGSIWSIYEVSTDSGFFELHPWQGASVLVYGRITVKIKGPTWGDLYRAADEAIAESGDDHHCFIEAFGKYATDNSMLELTTGS
jgi:hypothetical protein